MSIMDLLIPHACPPVPTGPPSLVKGHQGPYIARHGALPPHWGEGRREQFEAHRDDAVMIMHRHGATKNQRENARVWLGRYALDLRGRPLAWNRAAADVNALALAR